MRLRFSSRMVRNALVAGSLCSAVLYGCGKDDDPPVTVIPDDPSLANINFSVPFEWPAPVYHFENNPLTKEGFKLGRQLFFETKLSRDNSISCGSCHQPFAAFAQFEHSISHGVEERIGTRNSPALFNLSWHTSFFWDGGVNHIELQPFAPITNPVEMDETLAGIVDKLQSDQGYRALFKEAFGSEEVTTQKISRALAQFMCMLVSANSRYDKLVRHERGEALNQEEMDGLDVFLDKCASCHKQPLFTDFSFRNNGLALIPNSHGVIDSGRGVITPFDPSSFYKFKVPSLRNLKYTAPYMHDGRFTSIDEVLEHYNSGVQHTPNLDPLLQNGISLNEQEKKTLKAFLNTLNDEEFVKDVRFQEPK